MAESSLISTIARALRGPEPETFQQNGKPARGPLGRSGTVNTTGFISDIAEQNWRLRWPYSVQTFQEMRRTDSTVRWMLALIETPIRAATWMVEPAGEEPEDAEIAAFCECALFTCLDAGFDEFLRQALTYLAFGHSVFERVADLREVSFDFEHQGSRREVEREAFVVGRLAVRLAHTIEQWIPDPRDSSKLREIVQFLGDGQEPSNPHIPADRLVVFTHEKEGDDWRGTSLLRTAYKAWKFKRALEQVEAIAYERSAGVPVAYPPDDASTDELDDVESALKALRQGENLWIIMPGPKQGTNPESRGGWLLEDFVVRGEGGIGTNMNEAISRYDAEMARNVLAEFMRLGHENVGARATADVQQDPYYQAVEAHVRYIEDVVSDAVIRPLVDWNYETDRYPRLKAAKVQAKNVSTVFKAISDAVTAAAINPDLELENWLRSLLDAPERQPPEEGEEELPTQPPQPPPPEEPEPGEGPGPGETEMQAQLFSAEGDLEVALKQELDANVNEALRALQALQQDEPAD